MERSLTRNVGTESTSNPHPMREINHQDLMKFAAKHGFDQVVIWARKIGDDGGMCVAASGLGYRNGRVAQELAEILKGMSGFYDTSDIDATIDAEVAAAKREMAEAPEGGDPETGKKLLRLDVPKKDRVRK